MRASITIDVIAAVIEVAKSRDPEFGSELCNRLQPILDKAVEARWPEETTAISRLMKISQ